MGKSILDIISTSRLPNFIIIKQAFVYRIIFDEVSLFAKQSLASFSDQEDYIFDCFVNFNSKIVLSIKTQNPYLAIFFNTNKEALLIFLVNKLKERKIITHEQQLQIT